MKQVLFFVLLFAFISCATSYREEVISRVDDLDEKPKWASITKTMYSKGGKVYIVGLSSGPVDSRFSALGRIADNNARFELSRFIKNEMGFVFQNVEEGKFEGADATYFYGTELSEVVAHGVNVDSRYYEKILTIDHTGEKKITIFMYSLLSIKESTLKRMVQSSIRKGNKLNEKIKEKVIDHFNKKISDL